MSKRRARSLTFPRSRTFATLLCTAALLAFIVGACTLNVQQRQSDGGALCETCAISFGPEVIIGDREDNQLDYPMLAFVMNSRGHVIAMSPGQVQEFDAQGDFVRRIGGTGDGPGEFGRLRGLAAGPNDSLFVVSAGRVSVFDREGTYVRQASVNQGPIGPLRLESGEFVSTSPTGLSAGGSTLYIYDSAWEPRAFDVNTTGMPTGSALAGPVLIGPASGAGFWVAAQAPYRLERWSVSGDVELVLTPASDHLPYREHTRVLASGRSVSTRTPLLSAVAEDREGRLWTSVVVQLDEGEGDLPPSGLQLESVIEVRDLSTGDLLATGRVRGSVYAIDPDGRLTAVWEDVTGERLIIARRAHLDVGQGADS